MDLLILLAISAVWFAAGLLAGRARWHRTVPQIQVKSNGHDLNQAELDQIATAVQNELRNSK